MGSDNQSTERMGATNSTSAVTKEFKTLNDVIFGWDKFNATTLLILIVLFCLWCVIFFVLYDPHLNAGEADHGGAHH